MNLLAEVTSCFDETANRFLIAFKYTLQMMEIKPEVLDRPMTHSNSVVSVKFNKYTNQVVTLSEDGTLYTWLLETGQRVKAFSELHGSADLMGMDFDETNTRLYTAGADGNIKVTFTEIKKERLNKSKQIKFCFVLT